MDSTPESNPFRGATLILTKEHIRPLLNDSTDDYQIQYLLAYASDYGCDVYITGKVFKEIKEVVGENNTALQAIKGCFKDGSDDVGETDFGSEEQDMTYLYCSLYTQDKNKKIWLVYDDYDKIKCTNHDHIKPLQAQLKLCGIDKINIKVISLEKFVTATGVFDEEFKKKIDSYSTGTY
ncbi:MAG: hypothetical protein V1875_00260 [Candidatus Altiarchaeota archaeon]